MLQTLGGYFKKRQKGLAVLASFAGGAYLLTQYARQRFKDVSERMILDSTARENLRRRFRQNQEDCTFVLLAQLPNIARQLFSELDVEALTDELQRRAEEAKRDKLAPANTPLDASTASLDPQSFDNKASRHPDTDGGSTSSVVDSDTLGAASVPLPQDTPSLEHGTEVDTIDPSEGALKALQDTRSKAELWQAIKIQTFHRTLSTLYLVSLLALHTNIQLNLLGRHNYVSSIYDQAFPQEDDERGSEIPNGFANGHAHSKQAGEPSKSGKLDPLAERQYLSLTWWYMERGWRNVSDSVRQAVEDSLESISLKAQYSSLDFNKLLLEIRRKIEYEATGAVHNFASALFPPGPEEERETLTQSGLPQTVASTTVTPELRRLMNETQDFIESPDFSIVLRSCLDRTFEILSSSLSHLFVNMPDASSNRFEDVSEKQVRLAAILPALARCSHDVLQDSPNEYTEALANNRELQEFSAVVFSHFVLE